MKQKLWIVTELFPPDETSTSYIMGEIANAMTRKYNVGVICGPEVYDKRKQLDKSNKFQLDSSIEMHRAEGANLDKNTTKGKAISFLLMSRRMMALVKRHVKRGDKVLMVTNPAPMVVLMSRLKAKIGFELNILVHDVFPENTKPAGLKLPFYGLFKRAFDKAYSKADRLIVLGRDMKDVMEQKIERFANGPVCSIIENWADIEGVHPQPFPMQAVRTNVIGTENVLDSAVDYGVKNVVVLSTDKAAYPINAMGISKAMMEKVAVAKARSLGNDAETIICCTRYGNVMASRGSVIPLWVEQIKSGNPITITDPGMTRYMMTLDDAVDLVLYAFENGNQGDLFVQKAPAATLDVLADALKELYNADTEVKIIGTRHGEKLYETLVTREEMFRSEDMGDYFRIPADARDLNYDKFFVEGQEDISKVEDYHSHNTFRLDKEGMKQLLLKLPEIREDLNLL